MGIVRELIIVLETFEITSNGVRTESTVKKDHKTKRQLQ